MRNQLLIISTILTVGTATASAFAFYSSPNKKVALLGEPRNFQQSAVAGASTQVTQNLLPQSFPLPQNCEVLSFSKNYGSYQLTCATINSITKTAREYEQYLKGLGWTSVDSMSENSILNINASYGKNQIRAKVFSDTGMQGGKTLVSINYFE